MIAEKFRELTKEELTKDAVCYVEEFSYGGMSSGCISGEFWLEEGIPLLCSRMLMFH